MSGILPFTYGETVVDADELLAVALVVGVLAKPGASLARAESPFLLLFDPLLHAFDLVAESLQLLIAHVLHVLLDVDGRVLAGRHLVDLLLQALHLLEFLHDLLISKLKPVALLPQLGVLLLHLTQLLSVAFDHVLAAEGNLLQLKLLVVPELQ